ncbi:MAG TPA: hypothetical protein VGP38_02500 [Rubrobacter sp.]|nr:hypothetical protein [Rubrobacter sp.]
MFTRLERNVYTVLVVLALCAAFVLAAPPAPVQAQAASTAEDTPDARENLSHVAVRPGDSLWTISEDRLGPNATPQRIANGAEQIYALNRGRIGADPNLILVGQELLVPPAMSERPTTAAPARKKTVEASGGGLRDRPAKSTPRTTAPSGADAKSGEVSGMVAERETGPAILPDGEVAAPVPAVKAVDSSEAQSSSVSSFLRTVRTELGSIAPARAESSFGGPADGRTEGRRLVGLMVLVLTFVVAALMMWKLPMRRTLWDAEGWGASASYYGELPMADRITPFVYHPGSLGGSDENRDVWDTRSRAPAAAVGGVRRDPLMALPGPKGGTSNGRRRPAPKAKAVARNSLALGAHNLEIRRVPRRAHATMRARKLHPRRLTTRQSRGVRIRDGR